MGGALAGALGRVPDARGLHHLRTLLDSPGREVHAADLVSPGSSGRVRAQAREALLDDTAKAAYRRRIRELQAEVAAAQDEGATESAARRGRSWTRCSASWAVGLGGRDRPAHDDAERARVAVRKALTATYTRLAEHDPGFAAHLRAAVRTGLLCSYRPDPALDVRWTLR